MKKNNSKWALLLGMWLAIAGVLATTAATQGDQPPEGPGSGAPQSRTTRGTGPNANPAAHHGRRPGSDGRLRSAERARAGTGRAGDGECLGRGVGS
jgi:hypothetical protein